MGSRLFGVATILACLLIGKTGHAQCPSLVPKPHPDPNPFSLEQEEILGGLVLDDFRRDYAVLPPELASHLNDIAGRLGRVLPHSGQSYRFAIVDIPQANAYSYPGGVIVISRKLLAATASDDEVAGII